ncbi:spore germination protein [Anaerobacillus alkalilacustris]|uniref:spore germination protein n=1 Tax=Anaerobacillus alkalilacustris TaxID=393763 RepID=UPI000A01CDC4|nr:spore germination protein [Anaerobacillus alkalilacustris]
MKWNCEDNQLINDKKSLVLDDELNLNIKKIINDLGNSSDLVVKQLQLKENLNEQIAVIYLEGLVSKNIVSDFIANLFILESFKNYTNTFDFMIKKASSLGDIKVIEDYNEILLSILSGATVILIDGCLKGISGSSQGGESRGVEEPSSQIVIRGPKDGFTESLSVNIALIRKRIKSPNVWVEGFDIGRVTHTKVAVMYMKGIVNEEILQEVKNRLNQIDIDGILESGNIEEFIEDRSFSPFPTVFNTERPDSVAGNLLEGRISILVNGTPFALIVPYTFFQSFQATEDYYQRYDIASLIRCLRFICFLIALLGPSVYIAAISFHPEMIPTPLLLSLAAQRAGNPFPVIIEALLMEFSFEILREAGIRMPRAVGQAVSIVGALILGEAAVQAGIVSPAMVIVVALTGIASFVSPSYNLGISIRMLRFGVMLAAGYFGFYGIAITNLMIIAHLCSLESFGVPYMAPLAPFYLQDQKDNIFRFPIWAKRSRPKFLHQTNRKRMDIDEKKYPRENSTN